MVTFDPTGGSTCNEPVLRKTDIAKELAGQDLGLGQKDNSCSLAHPTQKRKNIGQKTIILQVA